MILVPPNAPRIRSRFRALRHQRGLLAEELARTRAILETCHEGILVLDLQSHVLECNPSAARILGHPVEKIKGANTTNPAPFLPIDADGNPLAPENHPSRVVLRTGEPCLGYIHGLKDSKGHIIWLLVNAQPLRDHLGQLKGVVASMSDITKTKALEERLRREAYFDELTQLHNRRYFNEILKRATNASRRHGHPLSLCFCDLDHFKAINDTHGHAIGDIALQVFAEALQLGLRQDDLATRFGGDEFCILFAHSSTGEATIFLERLRQIVSEIPVLSERGEPLLITASFGVAGFHPEMDREQLLEAADQALYRAKQNGRNRVEVIE